MRRLTVCFEIRPAPVSSVTGWPGPLVICVGCRFWSSEGNDKVDIIDGEAIWRDARGHLADTLSKDVYDRWIAVIEFKEQSEDALFLAVTNDFYQTWLIENYLPLIRDAVAMAAAREINIEFVVDRAGSTNRSETSDDPFENLTPLEARDKASSHSTRPRRQHPKPLLNQKYTFDRYVVGPSNNFAHAATLAVAQSPARAYNPLFIYGSTGLGKTHLMQAIGHHVLQQKNQSHRICYLSSEEFTNEYIHALQMKEIVQFRRKYRSMDILLIDDIHFLGGKERIQEEFFHTFNALFDSHKQIVMTSDRPASEIQGLEHRLVSRFEWGLVTELETPDVETRIAILRKKQSQLNIELPPEVLEFIAEHIRSNIRRLEGALIRAASYTSLTGRALGISTLENLLRDSLDLEQQEAITIETIQRVVADYYDIRLGDMTSKRRPQSIAYPRQVAMYLCREMTDHSLPEIGLAFGRNHATVLHAHRQIGKRHEADATIRKTLSVIRGRLEKR